MAHSQELSFIKIHIIVRASPLIYTIAHSKQKILSYYAEDLPSRLYQFDRSATE